MDLYDVCLEAIFDSDPERVYREQLRLCSEHGMICLEYYRRHGVPKKERTELDAQFLRLYQQLPKRQRQMMILSVVLSACANTEE